MHHDVGIAADRRGEVHVGRRRERGVAAVDRVVARELERAQEQRAEGLARRRAARAARLEQLRLARHRARGCGAVARSGSGATGRPSAVSRVGELQQRLVLRMLVHAVERRAPGAGEQAADGLVREQHELLDERVRARLLVPARIQTRAVGDLERELARRQREGAAGVPARPQIARQRVGARQQLAVRVVAAALQHLVRLVVAQASAAADQRAPDVRRPGHAVGADAHLDADHAADLARAQAAGVGRELERQHRLDRSGHVHAAGAPRRLGVERAAGLHVARDVGDVHAGADAVAVRLDADGIVEIARRRRVDRDRLELEQVRPLARPARARATRAGPRAARPPATRAPARAPAAARAARPRRRRATPAARRRARCLRACSTTTSSPACTASPERRPSANCWPSSKNGCATRKRPRRSTVQATSRGPPSSSITEAGAAATGRLHEQPRVHRDVRAEAVAVHVEPVGRAVVGHRELDGAAAGHGDDRLDGSLAERARADDLGALVLAQGRGDDLGGAGRGADRRRRPGACAAAPTCVA